MSDAPQPTTTPSTSVTKQFSLIHRFRRCKWGCIRLFIAAFLLWAVAIDTPARLARLELASLPNFDYVKEVESLRLAGRYGEAVMIAQSGLDRSGDAALSDEEWSRLDAELVKTLSEQQSWVRKAQDAGLGALSGRADSLEGLIGAVAADFFVVGDLRDLVIEGGKLALDGESDEVILALSGVGLATTAAPEIDWAPSLLKAAKRAGTLTKRFGEQLVTLVRQGKKDTLLAVLGDVSTLSKKASPGGAMRLLRHAESADDLKAIVRFVERHPHGAFALHVAGDSGATIVKDAAKLNEAAASTAKVADNAAPLGESTLIKSARKGERGVRLLTNSRAGKILLKPHALVGLAKGLWKGNLANFAQRLVDRFGPNAWWLLPLLAAWTFVEVVLIARKVGASSLYEPEARASVLP